MSSQSFEDFDGPEVELARGRQAPMHTQVHDWVALSGASPAAVALYLILKMHLNRERGDKVCWPTTLSLALLIHRSRGDKITDELQELVKIKAIEIDSWGMPRRYKYTLNEVPPEDYEGPLTLQDWYLRNKPKINAIRAEEKKKRDARRKSKKEHVTPVPPDSGEQGEEVPVPPDRGEQVAPEGGEHVTPVSGREPRRKRTQKKTTNPHSPLDDSAAAEPDRAATAGEEISEEEKTRQLLQAGLAKALELRPGWTRWAVRKAMQDALGAGRSPEDVATAITVAAKDGTTQVPRRIVNELWWQDNMPKVIDSLPPADPCMKEPGHLPYPADNCAACKVEGILEAAEKTAPERAAAEAAAVAQMMAARQSAGAQAARQVVAHAATHHNQEARADRRSKATRT